MSDEAEKMETRMEAIARIPSEQKFTWKITPMPGRLLFADTVGKSLVALKDIFQSVGDVLGEEQVVSILDARMDADGAFAVDLVVMPVERPS